MATLLFHDMRGYDVNVLSPSIGVTFCIALPFFYAFTGCDTVSSFISENVNYMMPYQHSARYIH